MSERGRPFASSRTTHFQWAIEAEVQTQALCMWTKKFHRAFEALAARIVPKFEGN